MLVRVAVVLALFSAAVFAGDWDPALAAQYLDGRQKLWFAWPTAAAPGGPCLSCHTTVSYLLARPGLRRALSESTPTQYETGLLDGVKTRASKRDAPPDPAAPPKSLRSQQDFGTQAVLAALVLALDDRQRGGGLSSATEAAFERMWSTQIREGKDAGAWLWTDAVLDPFETRESMFFGAALAALATGAAPARYQFRPGIRENLDALKTYLGAHADEQPLHNRLALVWASTRFRDLIGEDRRKRILDEVWQTQESDGGWTIPSIGPWMDHPKAPPTEGSSAYATAWVSFTVQAAGIGRDHRGLARALAWLKSHQDPRDGSWAAVSLNKQFQPGSMPAQFMRDAATGLAVLALLPPAEGRGRTD